MVAQMSQLQNAASNGIYGMASQGNPNDNLSSLHPEHAERRAAEQPAGQPVPRRNVLLRWQLAAV
jgi:hypothetical protein